MPGYEAGSWYGILAPSGTPGAIDNPFGTFLPIEVDRSYTDVLPSLNLAFDLAPQVVLRLGFRYDEK